MWLKVIFRFIDCFGVWLMIVDVGIFNKKFCLSHRKFHLNLHRLSNSLK